MVAVAECDGDGELAIFGDVDLAHQSEVAVKRLTEVPGHAHVRGEILKAVAGADVAATGAGETAIRTERQRDVVLPRENAALPGDAERTCRVAVTASIEMRSQQSVTLEPRQDAFVAFDLDVHQHHGMMRIGDELLGNGVASAKIVGDDAHRQRVVVNVVEVVLEVALLFVEERLLVGEEEFHVAGLRAIDGGIINFVQRAVRRGCPDAAGGCVSGKNCVFLARSPTWFEAGSAKCWSIIVKPVVRSVQSTHAGY